MTDMRVFEDLDQLSRAAAEFFVSTAAEAVKARGRFLVALSGGGTPMGTYTLLASPAYDERVDWSDVFVFWADERCVPPDDPGSNYGEAQRALLGGVSIPADNVLRVQGELTPCEAARDYAHVLKRFASPPLGWPVLDLALLGMGEDGHTASLFPGSPLHVESPVLAVTADYQGRPAERVTLTPLVFNAARRVLFLVSGAGKASTLASVLNEGYMPEKFPAQRIRPDPGELLWMVDRAAASQLED